MYVDVDVGIDVDVGVGVDVDVVVDVVADVDVDVACSSINNVRWIQNILAATRSIKLLA